MCGCRGNWWKWALLGAAGALYWVGRQQRARTRIPAISGIEEPAAARAHNRVMQLPHFRRLLRYFARYATRGRQNVRVLDVGCGAGHLAIALARRREVRDVTGIDLADTQIHLARENTERLGVDANFLIADAAELPFPDSSFDVVVATLSLHHIERPEEALREIRRVLAPGGSLLLLDIRRDVPSIFLGAMAVATRYLVSETIRATGEPLSSFQAAYKPWEISLLACKAGWPAPRITTWPIGMLLEAEKGLE
jgi:ubiquinone/menaquinone biosynthesis C-methylase UbiE